MKIWNKMSFQANNEQAFWTILDNDFLLFSALAFFSIWNLPVKVALWGISQKKQQKLKNENVIKGCINIK